MTTQRVSRGIPLWLGITIAVLSGALVAVQTRINGQLGEQLDDGYTAAAISFGSGLIILTVILAFNRRGRDGLRRLSTSLRDRSTPWWVPLGGLAGAWFVLSQGLAGAVLGVALFTVALVAGQTVAGLVLDRIGFGPGGRLAVTWTRLLGSLLALVAVIWSVSAHPSSETPFWLMALPLIAGFGMGVQQALNGRVRQVARSAFSATFVNFAIGTAALIVVAIVHGILEGPPAPLPTDWWLYVGGALGCVFIGVNAFLVAHTGVLVLGLSTVAGQLIAALVLDLVNPTGVAVHWTTIAGTALALIAVIVAGIRPPARR